MTAMTFGMERIVHVELDDPGIGADIEMRPGDRQMTRAFEDAACVPGERAVEEVVARLAVAAKCRRW